MAAVRAVPPIKLQGGRFCLTSGARAQVQTPRSSITGVMISATAAINWPAFANQGSLVHILTIILCSLSRHKKTVRDGPCSRRGAHGVDPGGAACYESHITPVYAGTASPLVCLPRPGQPPTFGRTQVYSHWRRCWPVRRAWRCCADIPVASPPRGMAANKAIIIAKD